MNIIIFNYFFNLSLIPVIAKLALFLSYPFTYGLIFLLIFWAIFLSRKKMFNFSLLFLSVVFSWITASFIKNTLRFSRPYLELNIVPLFEETGFSFPSEHMAIFTAIAISMFLIDKRAGYIFSLIAILIGLSRIVIGVHYPVDILGGAIVGIVISLIFTSIYKKI
jgi:undecaprenyl-diphosphatase